MNTMTLVKDVTLSKNMLTIDFPRSGEVLTSPDYTLRVYAPGAASVEVAIDGGDWKPCRSAVGYWWYDWTGYEPGLHQVRARSCNADGMTTAVESLRIQVQMDGVDEPVEEPPQHRAGRG